MLTQFVAAFDGAFVYRYDKNEVAKEKINVRYVMGPKHRVLYDIVNQAKNITLPVVAIEQTNIKRDASRIHNKDQHMYRPHLNDKNISKIPQPVPVSMDISVHIIANYKEDVDQIVANFIPWCNPYFIISWKIPKGFGLDFTDELRSEVSWSGDISFENPVDISAQDKYKITATTSFTIKGWLFPALEVPVAPIYVIDTNFHAVATGDNLYSYDSYSALSGVDYPESETASISAYPEFTNNFFDGNEIIGDMTIQNNNNNYISYFGKRFNYNNSWYLSANTPITNLIYEQVTTAKFPTISAYRLPDSFITVVDDNHASISLSSNSVGTGTYTLVTSNSAGWVANGYNVIVI